MRLGSTSQTPPQPCGGLAGLFCKEVEPKKVMSGRELRGSALLSSERRMSVPKV